MKGEEYFTFARMRTEGEYRVGDVVTARTRDGYEGSTRGTIIAMTGIRTSPWKVLWENGRTSKTNLSAVVKVEYTRGPKPNPVNTVRCVSPEKLKG